MAERILLDTTVLVAGYIEDDPFHADARPLLKQAHQRDVQAYVAAHSLAEMYNVLVQPRFEPELPAAYVRNEIVGDVEASAVVVSLDASEYSAVLDRMQDQELRERGLIFDGLIAQAALSSGVERLATFNIRDFRRLGSDVAELVYHPGTS